MDEKKQAEIKRIEKAIEILNTLYELQMQAIKNHRKNTLRHQYDFENN